MQIETEGLAKYIATELWINYVNKLSALKSPSTLRHDYCTCTCMLFRFHDLNIEKTRKFVVDL